jgi:hypothetical protein
MIRVVHPGYESQTRIFIFYPSRIPDPGVKKAPDPGVKKTPDPGSVSAKLISGPDIKFNKTLDK